MALAPRLELRQGQALVMTPQLQQAIKLLQLSNLELSNFVEQELEKNPLLDRDERPEATGDTEFASSREEAGDVDPAASAAGEMDSGYDDMYPDDGVTDRAEPADPGPSAAMGGSDWSSAGSGGAGRFDDPEFSLENRLSREQTLAEHLAEQLEISFSTPADKLVAGFLIDAVDEAGYLRLEDSLEEVAERLGAELADVERILKVLQGFEPTGVCARDLKECMALQLAERNRLDPAMQAFLDNLELVARRDTAQLCKLCGVDEDDIRDMLAEIRSLDPRPGLTFGGEAAPPVVPDVFVRASQSGGWTVELNTETLPRVLVNQQYYATVSGGAVKKDEKTYLSDCLQSANWLVKSLDQRARTILKVSREIVRQQDAFLVHGVSHLKPLNLKTIAEAIDMHESTVSRVTSNKFMATPRGMFELKYFFTSAINSTDGGDAHSAEAVRHRIRELVDSEAPAKILSDDKIVEILKVGGIDIARRTVAKYREAMGIPSSVERRRMKKLSA